MVFPGLRPEASLGSAISGGTGHRGLIFLAVMVALAGCLASARHASGGVSGDVSIGRADKDGTDVNPVLINHAGSGRPGDVATGGGHLYWINGDAIARAELDGSDIDLRFITGLSSPSGLTVGGQHLYWGGDSIGRAGLDATDIQPAFMTPAGGADDVASNGQHLYWTSHEGIGRANLDGTGQEPAFIETGVREMTPGDYGNPSVHPPMHLAVNGTRVFWVYPVSSTSSGYGIGRANLDASGIEYPILGGKPDVHVGTPYGSLAADDARVFFEAGHCCYPTVYEINSFDANFASGSPTGCCSPSWPLFGSLDGGVAVSGNHVYWTHIADRVLNCFLDPGHSYQRQAGRRVRFKAWLTNCEQVSVRASGKARIAGQVYTLKRKSAVVGPASTSSGPVSVALRPRRKHRREILAKLKDGKPAYGRIKLEIADASDNSRATTYTLRLERP